ncbi:MAG: hypothetical protein KKB62_02865 [Nanoarchaeota archaeon]|jgi:hypothetical protein|nr:hypothetical protein [Nanoarchaeota archaeon]
MKKRGEILAENVIFLVLNIIFLTILVLFLLKQAGGAVLIEGSYSKEIALLVDSAKHGTIINVNLQKAKEVSDENGIDFSEILKIADGYVTIKLSDKGGSSYHYFNDINVSYYPDKNPGYEGFYVLNFNRKRA